MVRLRVKWGKIELENDFEVNLSATTTPFIEKLFEITNVPVDKQKLLIKGKMIKNGAKWSDYPQVKANDLLILMGTAKDGDLKDPKPKKMKIYNRFDR
jgi:ubiquitin carboxyl-terminal hydrolase 14